MLYHKQIQLWNKEDKIPTGSCYPTVLACLLDLPLDKVPYINLLYFKSDFERNNFDLYRKKRYTEADHYDEEQKDKFISQHISSQLNLWNQALEMWLISQGYYEDYCPDIERFIKENPDKPYMVTGVSLRGVQHVVIGLNGEFHHDPHPSNTFLVTPPEGQRYTYTFLEKIENYGLGRYYEKLEDEN